MSDAPPDAPDGSEPAAGEPELSAGTRRAFWIATLALPLVFFALLEGGLRLFGYGASLPLFVDVENAEGYRMPSRDVAGRYFANQESVPTPNPDVFHADKPEGSVRLVAQGGSSAAGYPFYRGASFPQTLGTRLRLAYPDREIEVVNTAMAAVNSYTLVDFADEIVEIEPDAVLVYAGHNEYYGALGAASTESLGGSRWLVRTYLALDGLRTVQLLRNALAAVQRSRAERAPGERPSNTLMARMIGEQEVAEGSPTFQAGLEQFRENLDALLATYQREGIPVYVGTLASNERDQRPFVTVHAPGVDPAAWRAELQRAIAVAEGGDARAGVAALRAVVDQDPGAADGHYVLGHALLAGGDRDAAAQAFRRARDLDALRFRAPTAFNEVIREVARARGAHVVETERALAQATPDRLVGRVTMLEHLHPTMLGYALMADAFFEALAEHRVVSPEPPRPTPPGRIVQLVTPADSLAGRIRVEQLTSNWPFRPDERQPLQIDSARTPPFVVETARELLGGAPWLQTTDELAAFYESNGRIGEALTARRAIVQAFPFLPGSYVGLANLELQRATARGDNGAIGYVAGLYEQALERDSMHADANAMLGALALQAGAVPQGTRYLERAVEASPTALQPLYNLAGAYAMQGRWDEAEQATDRLLQAAPGDERYRRLAEGIQRRAL